MRARAGAAVALRVGREGEARRHTAVRLSRGHSRRTRLGRESGRPERRVPRRLPGRRAVRDSVGGGGEGARRGRGGFVFVHARVPSRRVPPRRRLRRRRRPSIVVVVVVVHPVVGISRSVPGVGAERAVGGGGCTALGASDAAAAAVGPGRRQRAVIDRALGAPARRRRSGPRFRSRSRRGSSGTRGGGEGRGARRRGGESLDPETLPEKRRRRARVRSSRSVFSPSSGGNRPRASSTNSSPRASRPTPPGRGRRRTSRTRRSPRGGAGTGRGGSTRRATASTSTSAGGRTASTGSRGGRRPRGRVAAART